MLEAAEEAAEVGVLGSAGQPDLAPGTAVVLRCYPQYPGEAATSLPVVVERVEAVPAKRWHMHAFAFMHAYAYARICMYMHAYACICMFFGKTFG